MDISVDIKGSNFILVLTNNIVQDWIRKINHETSSQKSLNLKILLSDKILCPPSSRAQNDLIILLKDADIYSAHILALSGQLSTFGQTSTPFLPKFISEITIANCIAIQIIQFVYQKIKNQGQKPKTTTNSAQILTISGIQCLKYFGAFNISAKHNGMISNPLGQNILDGGAPFYKIYETKDGALAIGNLQPKFYEEMIEGLQLNQQEKDLCLNNQLNVEMWPKISDILASKFKEKTAKEWETIMANRDTCITAVKKYEQKNQAFLHPEIIRPKL